MVSVSIHLESSLTEPGTEHSLKSSLLSVMLVQDPHTISTRSVGAESNGQVKLKLKSLNSFHVNILSRKTDPAPLDEVTWIILLG